MEQGKVYISRYASMELFLFLKNENQNMRRVVTECHRPHKDVM